MNKKIIVLPLAIIATSLASCNKGWPTLSEEDAISRANKVVEYQSSLKDLDSSTYNENSTCKTKYNDKEYSMESSFNVYVDVTKKYFKSYTTSKTVIDNVTTEYVITTYFLVKDNKYYGVADYNKNGQSIDKGKVIYASESEFLEDYNTIALSYYNISSINYEFYTDTQIDLSNLKDSIDEYKEIQEEIKDKQDQHFNYSFISNGDYNFGVKFDSSLIYDDTSKYTATDNSEYIIENGIYVSSNTSYSFKGESNEYYTDSCSIRFNPNAGVSVDDIDLESYPTKE